MLMAAFIWLLSLLVWLTFHFFLVIFLGIDCSSTKLKNIEEKKEIRIKKRKRVDVSFYLLEFNVSIV